MSYICIMQKKNIIICEGNRPLWQNIIAALNYTAGFVFLYLFLKLFRFDLESLRGSIGVLILSFLGFSGGFALSYVNNIILDLNNRQFKNEYVVSFIKIGKWQKLPNILYISVFKQLLENRNYIFKVNVWHQKNKHFTIYESFNYESALEMGFHISNKLEVKLLDATKPNNYKYLSTQEVKEKLNL